MKRKDLEHLIRSSGAISGNNEIIIIGSQAVLGQFPDAPVELLMSNEADIIIKQEPDKSDLIDGAIGEDSSFHETFGYYAQGVGYDTARLPAGWEERCILIDNESTQNVKAYCLEIHDLCISKYVTSRKKDLDFISECIKHNLVNKETMILRINMTELSDSELNRINEKIESDFSFHNSNT
jgi:hypothetical protein